MVRFPPRLSSLSHCSASLLVGSARSRRINCSCSFLASAASSSEFLPTLLFMRLRHHCGCEYHEPVNPIVTIFIQNPRLIVSNDYQFQTVLGRLSTPCRPVSASCARCCIKHSSSRRRHFSPLHCSPDSTRNQGCSLTRTDNKPCASSFNGRMTAPLNLIGPAVRKFRNQKNWTQEALAARLQVEGWDVSRESVAKLEAQFRRARTASCYSSPKSLASRSWNYFLPNLI